VIVPPSRTAQAYRWVERSHPAGATWLLRCLEERARFETGETLF
jgi:hypothetical protein